MATASPPKRRRPDGRPGGGTLRPLSAETSALSRPDGSALFSAGSTRVLAACYGPAAPRAPSREDPTGARVACVFRGAVASRGLAGGGGGGGGEAGGAAAATAHPGYGATERELERFVGDALAGCICLEKYPRTIIEVVVQVIQSDGSVVGTALNAAALALMDAGIEMRAVPVATTCVVLKLGEGGADDKMRLDPTAEEEATEGAASAVLVTDGSRDGGVLASMTSGTMSVESLLLCVEGGNRAGKAVVAFLRLAVEQKVTREAQTLWSS